MRRLQPSQRIHFCVRRVGHAARLAFEFGHGGRQVDRHPAAGAADLHQPQPPQLVKRVADFEIDSQIECPTQKALDGPVELPRRPALAAVTPEQSRRVARPAISNKSVASSVAWMVCTGSGPPSNAPRSRPSRSPDSSCRSAAGLSRRPGWPPKRPPASRYGCQPDCCSHRAASPGSFRRRHRPRSPHRPSQPVSKWSSLSFRCPTLRSPCR